MSKIHPAKDDRKGVAAKHIAPQNQWLKYLLIALISTAVALSPILNNDFINFDDPNYITENPAVQKLTSENIKSYFTQQFVGTYQPPVMLLYAFQYSVFGQQAGGYHAISLLLHLLNTALVFIIIFRLFNNQVSALIAALLFGLHPLHVESVAWVSAQKDVVYTFFFLGSVYFYLKGNEDKSKSRSLLLLGLLFFILSCLSKAQAVVLPFVLVLVDYWRKKSFSVKDVAGKLPYFVVALCFGALAYIMQKKAGAVQDFEYFSVGERILFSCYGFVNYLWQTVLPVHLSVFYPYPESYDKINSNWVYIAPFIILALTILVFRMRKKSPVTIFGVLFFCFTIAPVIQLIPVGDAIHADRYTYISLTGIFLIPAYYISEFMRRRKTSRFLPAVLAVYFLVLGGLTFSRAQQWKDSISIYTASLEHHEAPIMYANRSADLYKEGRYKEAIDDLNKAIDIKPRFPNAYKNRGLTYEKTGDYLSAVADYTNALTYKPDDATLYQFRANCYKNLNRFEEAIGDYTKAISMNPELVEAYYGRAEALGRSGRPNEAVKDLDVVVQKKPDFEGAYNNRGIANSMAGNFAAALSDYNKALELNPKAWSIYTNRSMAYNSMGDYRNAYRDALTAKNNGENIDANYLMQLEAKSK